MKSSLHKKQVQARIAEAFGRFVQYARGGDPPTLPLDFDGATLALKQALAFNPDEFFEFQERSEEIKEAELERLDDFLL